MTYRIARNGQMYGPYTLAEVERYLASGNIVYSDLAQAEGSAEWFPVSQLFPTTPLGATTAGATGMPYTSPDYSAVAGSGPAYGGPAYGAPGYPTPAYAVPVNFDPSLYPDPPDLPWWLALILGLVTGGLFFVAWDIYQAAWMRKIQPRSVAVYLYAVAGVLFLINLPSSWHSVGYWVFHTPFIPAHHSGTFSLLRWGIWLAARFVFRSELLDHFNREEPLGLRLSGFLTFLLGGLYFQFHFNQINAIKRSLRLSVPAV